MTTTALLVRAMRAWREARTAQPVTPELRAEVCMLAAIVMHGRLSKIGEEVFAAATGGRYTVRDEMQGADLTWREDDSTFDLKTTQWSRGKQANVNWSLGTDVAADIADKLRGKSGAMIVAIMDHRCKPVHEYHIGRRLLLGYFSRRAQITPGVTKYNLGCKRCANCGEFHRIKRLHDASVDLNALPEDEDLPESVWKHLLGRCPANCT